MTFPSLFPFYWFLIYDFLGAGLEKGLAEATEVNQMLQSTLEVEAKEHTAI